MPLTEGGIGEKRGCAFVESFPVEFPAGSKSGKGPQKNPAVVNRRPGKDRRNRRLELPKIETESLGGRCIWMSSNFIRQLAIEIRHL